jgi:hypothetical protein
MLDDMDGSSRACIDKGAGNSIIVVRLDVLNTVVLMVFILVLIVLFSATLAVMVIVLVFTLMDVCA